MKKIYPLLSLYLLLTSCSTGYKYMVSLSDITTSDNVQITNPIKIVPQVISDKTYNEYKDNNIEISWYVSQDAFNFKLYNRSNDPIKLPWDEVTFIQPNGETGRTMHNGVRYIKRNESQPASIIPSKSTLNDFIIPTDKVYFSINYYSESAWKKVPLFNFDIKNLKKDKEKIIGTKVKIFFPLIIKSVTYDYTFTFTINDIVESDYKTKDVFPNEIY
jgi:hypothetical protein